MYVAVEVEGEAGVAPVGNARLALGRAKPGCGGAGCWVLLCG